MKKLKVFDQHGIYNEKSSKVSTLMVYAKDRLYRLLLKLMRAGVSHKDALIMVTDHAHIAADDLVMKDLEKLARRIKNEKKTKRKKSGPTGS
jgi:predicted site-specific integrase-resolvase